MSASVGAPSGDADLRYERCLHDFVARLLKQENGNIRCIVLYGGLVRDGEAIPGWSDIDLVVVFEDILARNAPALASLLDRAERLFAVRLDVTQLDVRWLLDPLLLASYFNGEVLNSLAMRPDVSRVLYGTVPQFRVSPGHERTAAIFYIDHTMGAFRRYLVENLMRARTQDGVERGMARVTRWVFSIIRASLRLFGVYVHPYGPSLEHVKTLFPHVDLSVPYTLLNMRRQPATIRADQGLFASIEAFLETYVQLVLSEARRRELD